MPVLGFSLAEKKFVLIRVGPPLGFSKSRSHQMAIVPFALSVMPSAARQVLHEFLKQHCSFSKFSARTVFVIASLQNRGDFHQYQNKFLLCEW